MIDRSTLVLRGMKEGGMIEGGWREIRVIILEKTEYIKQSRIKILNF